MAPAERNWRLQQASPCVDTGDTLAWMAAATDLDGGPRVRYDGVDMGCYEARLQFGTIIHVR